MAQFITLHTRDKHMLNTALHEYPDQHRGAIFQALAGVTNKNISLLPMIHEPGSTPSYPGNLTNIYGSNQ